MGNQAKSWAELKVSVTRMQKTLAEMPAPPTPRDTWSEKVNVTYRSLEGMSEQLNSEIENEDARLAEREAQGDEN